MVAQVGVRGQAAISPVPTGWTSIRKDTLGTSGYVQIFYKVATATEPTSYAFKTTDAIAKAGGITAWTGVKTSGPVDVSSGATGSGASATAPSVTTTAANDVLLYFGFQVGDVTYTPPTGMTERWDVSAGPQTYPGTAENADQIIASAGATGTRTGTASGAGGGFIAELVALKSS